MQYDKILHEFFRADDGEWIPEPLVRDLVFTVVRTEIEATWNASYEDVLEFRYYIQVKE